MQLQLDVAFEKSSYTYAEMGGALMAGNYSITTATPGAVTLVNGEEIPLSYQTSDNFKPYWTYDGSSPISSGTAVAGADFTNGFPGDDVPIELVRGVSQIVVELFQDFLSRSPRICRASFSSKRVRASL